MFSFFRSKAELGIVFHIGTASVGAGLIKLEKGAIPRVVYTLREPIPYRERVAPDKFMADMFKALKEVNERLAKEGLAHLKFTEFGRFAASRRVSHIFYVFSSPWAATQTKVVSIKEKEPFVLGKDQVDRLIAAHENMFRSEVAGDEDAAKGLKAIERKIVDIKLNGYPVSEPFGKKAKTADVSFFTSIIPEALYEKVLDVSVRTYHPHETQAHSFALASFSVIRDSFHEDGDFIFLDIGGELSDVSVVKDGLIIETASFPLGRHFIVRKVAKSMDVAPEEAKSLCRLYEEGHADKAVADKIGPIIEKAAEEWSNAYATVLEKIAGKAALPTRLFVLMNSDFVQLFMKTLRADKPSDGVPASSALSVTLLNADRLKQSVSFGKHADKDPFIALIASFAGKVYESSAR